MRILSPMPAMSPHLSVGIFQVPPDTLQMVQDFLRAQGDLLPYLNGAHGKILASGAMHDYPCILDGSIHAGVDWQAGTCVLSTNTTSVMAGRFTGVIPIFVNVANFGFTRIRCTV